MILSFGVEVSKVRGSEFPGVVESNSLCGRSMGVEKWTDLFGCSCWENLLRGDSIEDGY